MSLPDPLSRTVLADLGLPPDSAATWTPSMLVVARVQHLEPAINAVGLLVAGGVVPVALLVRGARRRLWTWAGRRSWRWWPTPGSPAALRRA